MADYRVYLINPDGRVASGQWVQAATDDEAMRLAHALCDAGSPKVEVWQGKRRLGDIPCDETVSAA